MKKFQMIKKILIITALLVILVFSVMAYVFFLPRYHFISYGYHDIQIENEHGEWWIALDTYKEDSDDASNWQQIYPQVRNIYGSPYQLDVWHDSDVIIDKVEITRQPDVVFS